MCDKVVLELKGLRLNEKNSITADNGLDFIARNELTANVRIVTSGCNSAKLSFSEVFEGSIDNLLVTMCVNMGAILVSEDVNLRLRARGRGVTVIERISELY